jgi:hypothetical protein
MELWHGPSPVVKKVSANEFASHLGRKRRSKISLPAPNFDTFDLVRLPGADVGMGVGSVGSAPVGLVLDMP